MKYIVRLTLYGCVALGLTHLGAETKTDQEVFGKWIAWQHVFKDCSLTQMQSALNKNYWDRTLAHYKKHEALLGALKPFLQDVTGNSFEQEPASPMLSPQGKRTMGNLYAWLDRDMPKVFDYMKKHHFLDEHANDEEQGAHIDDVIYKYRKMLKVMFNHENKHIRHQYLFAVANRLFESCYGSWYNEKYNNFLSNRQMHQLGRFGYATMWYYLVGDGWKHWHDSCLQALEQEAKNKKELVYIAGGNDIYQLLKRGIYRIRVVDPMLPTQPAYYAEGWDWLLKGSEGEGIDDLLTIDVMHKKLVMKREKYQEDGTFQASLSNGEDAALPKSTTEWGIYDEKIKKRLGYVIFERRFCDRNDFVTRPDKFLLASFNEMYFAAIPDHLSGWGITADGVPANMKLYVKQLRKPVTKKVLANISTCEQNENFSFILLGSCPT